MNDILKISTIHPNAKIPAYASAEASGMDLSACLEEAITLEPFERVLVPTGLVIELLPGYEAQIRPRSGLASKHGITVLNSPGTVDSDYRGEVKVLLINLSQQGFSITNGERIAQMVIAQVTQATPRVVAREELGKTDRGAGGFGSTGR